MDRLVHELLNVVIDGIEVSLHIRRSARAQRAKIRALVDRLEVVLPRGAKGKIAERMVEEHKAWVLAHHLSLQSRQSKVAEGGIWFEGQKYRLETGPKGVVWDQDSLVVTAPSERVVAKWLWQESQRRVLASVAEHASRMGVNPVNIRFRKQKTVWGSCSTNGHLSFNLRLIMAPPEALEYVVVHELAHLLHPNHSRAFWDCVEQNFPEFKTCEKWLKEHYGELRACLDGL